MLEKLHQWLRLQVDADRLHALDNRLLADMGFEREHIELSVTTGVKVTSRLLADLRDGAEAPAEDGDDNYACRPSFGHYAAAGR